MLLCQGIIIDVSVLFGHTNYITAQPYANH